MKEKMHEIGQCFTTTYNPIKYKGVRFTIINIDTKQEFPYRVKAIYVDRSVNPQTEINVGHEFNWKDEGDMKIINNKKSIMENLKESASIAITPEPQKSFRKAGITNGDGFLTNDGVTVFLRYLLVKHADEFKKEVVDPILAEQKACK